MIDEELKPCPFCGKTPHIDYMGENDWDVECYCGAGVIICGPNGKTKAEAIAAWNIRV